MAPGDPGGIVLRNAHYGARPMAETRLLWRVIKPADDTITHPVDRCILETWYQQPGLAFTNYVVRETGFGRRTVRRRFYRLEQMGYVERYMDRRTFTHAVDDDLLDDARWVPGG